METSKLSLYEYAEIAHEIDRLLADRILIRLKNGSIVPRVCPYCYYTSNVSVPIVERGFDCGFTARDLGSVRNNKDLLLDLIDSKLKADGFDTGRFLTPFLAPGAQYAVYCDRCGAESGWYPERDWALREFNELIKRLIGYAREDEKRESGGDD